MSYHPTKSEALEYLQDIVVGLPDPYRGFCERVIYDEAFRTGIASSGHHPAAHQTPGGLPIHTAEVLHHCLSVFNAEVSLPVLITATIWHDYLKTEEYTLTNVGVVMKTLYARRIGHVVGGALEFADRSAGWDLPEREAILHCLLSHHGRREWGSPVTPATLEAHILHWADMLSTAGI